MIHLYTGDGKGKTTAAIGLCVRAAGAGMPAGFSQFMKGNDSGELHALKQMSGVRIVRSPKEFGFYHTLSEEQKAELSGIHDRLLDEIRMALERGECGMAVLDEITYPLNWGLLSRDKLFSLLRMARGQKEGPELVLTGRDPAPVLMECADYVTEMKAPRHPYEKGIPARKGIEY